jgi:hypothetical protein
MKLFSVLRCFLTFFFRLVLPEITIYSALFFIRLRYVVVFIFCGGEFLQDIMCAVDHTDSTDRHGQTQALSQYGMFCIRHGQRMIGAPTY